MHELPAAFSVTEEGPAAGPILRNLFAYYQHDMAPWFGIDTDEKGAYAYPVEEVWDTGCRVFLLWHGRLPVGFALVGSGEAFIRESGVYDVDEFFILRRYRRQGLGEALLHRLVAQMPGDWLVRVLQRNAPALAFWRRTLRESGKWRCSETVHHVDGLAWSYFLLAARGE